MKNEPVLNWAAVVGLVNAIGVLAVSFGLVEWTPEQLGNIEAFMIALGALLVPVILAYFPRARVTPLSKPRNNYGEELVPKG